MNRGQRQEKSMIEKMLNENFKTDDIFIMLTYRDEMTDYKAAVKQFNKFCIELQKEFYKQNNTSIRLFGVTSYSKNKMHHHLITQKKCDFNLIQKLWVYGIVRCSYICTNDLSQYASYLMKDLENSELMSKKIEEL